MAKPGRPTMLDPRTKLVLAFMAATAVALADTLVDASALVLATAIFIACRKSLKPFLHWLAVVLPMAVFFGLVTAVGAGMKSGLLAGMKLTGVTAVFFAFFITTRADELGDALIGWGLPFEAAFVFTAAMQFVPLIGRKARQVIDAQRCRGIPMEPGWRSLRHWPALLVPLVLQCFQLAEELAEAMAARGFGRPGRSFSRTFTMDARNWTTLALSAILLALYICYRH